MENTLEIKQPTDRDYIYFRQRQRNKVFQAVVAFFAENAEKKGLTKKELAGLLRRDPAQITRWLSGAGNWELDTMSDLLLAMGAEMDFQISPFEDDSKNIKIQNGSGVSGENYTAAGDSPTGKVEMSERAHG